MKTISNLLFATVICLAVFSCKKDKENEKDPSEYPFAKETVDEGKTKMEDAGQQLIVEMKAMEKADAGGALQAFADFYSTNDPFGSSTTKSIPVFRTISAVSAFSTSQNNLSYLSKLMKSDVAEDTSLLQFFNKYKGVYTWNLTTSVWVKTVSTEFKFIFPSIKGGTTNDASLVITYTGITALLPLGEYKGDLPTAFNASIIVKEKKVFEIDFKASYNTEGFPTSVNYFIALYPFKYEISWAYSSSSIELRYHLTNDSKNILDCFGGISGNFSKDNITTDSDPDKVFFSGNAYFQVFNIKLAGNIDFKNLYLAQKKIYVNGVNEFKADTAFVKEINNYVALNLVYADSKQKIASAEAYPIKKTRNYTYWVNNQPVTKEELSSDISMKFIFGDNSKSDMETYFNKGFTELINDLNTFIVELNNDYDLGIKNVN